MRTRLHVFVVFAAFALHTLVATGQVGLTEPAGAPGDGPITVFYPSSSTAAPLRRGPFNPHVAKEGAVQRGNGRLIVISHGSDARPWVQTDLAQHLVRAGYVVALPEHAGDNWRDMGKVGPESWKLRPQEVSRAIDARIKAVISAVPYAANFDMQTLTSPAVPLGIVQAGQDRWLVPRFHSAAVIAQCKTCETIANLPDAGHGALLAPLPPDTEGRIGRLLADPPGFQRAELPKLYQRIEAFFSIRLLP